MVTAPGMPCPCSPLLLFQVVYKSIFTLSSTLPALRRRQPADRPALTMGTPGRLSPIHLKCWEQG